MSLRSIHLPNDLTTEPGSFQSGKRLSNGHSAITLRLVDTATTGTGVVVLTYTTAVDAAA